MLPRTESFLAAHPEIWDDSFFAFGYGSNAAGILGKEAVLSFFGERFSAPCKSGQGTHELLVRQEALLEIEVSAGRSALTQLLVNDLRMFSCRKIKRELLERLVDVFFVEMGPSRIYTNTAIRASDLGSDCLGPWTPVTKHTMDTFLCVISPACVAYWLYGDDE